MAIVENAGSCSIWVVEAPSDQSKIVRELKPHKAELLMTRAVMIRKSRLKQAQPSEVVRVE
jgi:hypothetical protein